MLNLWSWDGKIGRGPYFATGLILFVIKHNLDRIVAAMAGYKWSPVSYWVFMTPDGITALSPANAMFYVVLLIVAIPFIWVGVVLTLRRLRDAQLPLWLVMLFFVPFLNLVFFVILSVIPTRQPGDEVEK